MTRYEFGTFDQTADGKEFRVIASQDYDSDAQAELNAQHILDSDNGEYDLTDMDGNRIKHIAIRRGDTVWTA